MASTKIAIDMLSKASKNLLYFIGCMPAGITEVQLMTVWSSIKFEEEVKDNIKDLITELLKLNLVEKSEN